MYDFLSDGAEYLSGQGKAAGKVNLEQLVKYLIGNRPDKMQREIVKDIFSTSKVIPGVGGKAAAKVGRFAGRIAPGLSALGNVADVADIIAGDDSFGNKAMDAVAMGLGGTAGAILGFGPLGASIGASAGKSLSDATQYLLGGGKSAEERKLEEALALLQRGRN